MSRLDSFYLPPAAWADPYCLHGDEAHHLTRVLRIKPGAQIRCFDGQGRAGIFTVLSLIPLVSLRLDLEIMPSPLTGETWLALGWNKSARRGWLLEKAVELGAAGILFWEAERGQGSMPDAPKESWLAQLIAGAKQCGNPHLPELAMIPGKAAGLIAYCRAFDQRILLWESPSLKRHLSPDDLASPGKRVFVLGPEGGLTDAETALFTSAGFTAATLGPQALRWETAALLSLGLSWWAQTSEGLRAR